MPFTFAHPAAVIPFYRRLGRFGVLSALIIGSLTPDLHYFLPFPIDRDVTHSLEGFFRFCLPVGIIAYLAFHLLLKTPVILLLPASIAKRLAPFISSPKQLFPAVSWIAVVFSLCIGTITHLVWDSFTHSDGPAVHAFPFLRTYLFSVAEYHVHLYQVFQQVSTLTGLALLIFWGRRWLRDAPIHSLQCPLPFSMQERNAIATGLLCVSLFFALFTALADLPPSIMSMFAFRDVLKAAVVAGISALGGSLVAYSVLWHLLALRQQCSA